MWIEPWRGILAEFILKKTVAICKNPGISSG